MQPWIARGLYFAAQRWRQEPVEEVLRELESSQRASMDELLELQWKRKQAIVRFAYDTVPFYRRRWNSFGFEPGDLKTPSDWDRLPILEKRSLQDEQEDMQSSRGVRSHLAATSGSSGTPVAVRRSQASWAHSHANLFRFYRWYGVDVGDRYAYVWGRPIHRKAARQARLKDLLFNRERCSAFDLSPETATEFYRRLVRKPVTYAVGYPSAIARFADELSGQALHARSLRWRVVVTTAESLPEHRRELITRAFGCPVVDSYGCAEVGIAGIVCPHGHLHVPVESVAVDIVRGEGGLEEVLLTDLHNTSQPIIRYRVGDLIERPSDTRCSCGRGLPRLGEMQGRSGGFLTLAGGRRISAHQASYIFKPYALASAIREYQFVQWAGGKVELRIVAGNTWRPEMKGDLEGEVLQVLGLDVEVRRVAAIERSERGKHRDFVLADDAEQKVG